MLGHRVKFGKHKGLTVKELIGKAPGYVKWAMTGITPAFLHVTALRYYFEAGGEVPREVRELLGEHGTGDEGWKIVGGWLNSI
jgi:hypothetical protein